MNDHLAAGMIFTLVFGSYLTFGLVTGRMPTPVISQTGAYRDEQPAKFWGLAALNGFGLLAGLVALVRGFSN